MIIVLCIILCRKTPVEHDQRLTAVLTCIQKAGLMLKLDKHKINRQSMKLLGQLIDETGVRPEPDKVRAIQKMKLLTLVS